MTRAMTSEELTAARADGQAAQLYLAFWQPATVFTCSVNGAPASSNSLMELTYDGGVGDYTDVIADMSAIVTTAAGAYKGMVRIRKEPTSDTLYIGEQSEINFADNDVITVIQEWDIWARHIRRQGGEWRIENVVYSDQHENTHPLPLLGPTAAVLWLDETTGEASFSPAASAYAPDGEDISGYLHAAPGSSALTNEGTSTPTITYDAAGQYLRSCRVSSLNGKTSTGYRYVFVFDKDNMPTTQFELTADPVGSREDGGWSFEVTLYDETEISNVRDKAFCVLFTQDYPASAGPVVGHENIVALGWVVGSSIEYSANDGSVTFEVKGPQHWLSQVPGFPAGLKDIDETPSSWLRYENLTVDAYLWHVWRWRSTASRILDLTVSGDTRRLSATDASVGGLWSEIKAVAGAVFAEPLCNCYGQVYVQVPVNLMPVASRSTVPTVLTLTTADWGDSLRYRRPHASNAALLKLSGVAWDGSTGTPYFSSSPGDVFAWHGEPGESIENMALTDQADANELAGLKMGALNNELGGEFDLKQNNRFIDICPVQMIAMNETTPEGALSTNAIPVRVTRGFTDGAPTVKVEWEGETTPWPAVTDPPPKPSDQNIPAWDTEPGLPDIDPYIPPPNDWWPPVLPPDEPPDDGGGTCLDGTEANFGGYLNWDVWTLQSDQATASAYAPYKCTLRPAGVDYPSQLIIAGGWYLQVDGQWVKVNTSDWWRIYAVDSGRNRISTGTVSNYKGGGGWEQIQTITFAAPEGGLSIAGFELNIDASAASEWILGALITTGHAAPTDSTGQAIGVPAGESYAVKGVAGYWVPGIGFPTAYGGMRIYGSISASYNDPGLGYYVGYNTYYIKSAANQSVYVRIGDSWYPDNTGPGIDWEFYHAIAPGGLYLVNINSASIHNVCAP